MGLEGVDIRRWTAACTHRSAPVIGRVLLLALKRLACSRDLVAIEIIAYTAATRRYHFVANVIVVGGFFYLFLINDA